MRRARLLATISFSSLVGVALFAMGEGCGGTDSHPGAGNSDTDGGPVKDATTKDNALPQFDANFDANGFDSGNSGCTNKFKDGDETDIDCGGTVCKKCQDTAACLKPADCAGGSCINNACRTVSCTNLTTDGDETDTDCGGTVCAKCTIGKHCKAATDCASATCDSGTQACACPAGMAIISKSTGGAYCVEQAEISKGQYNKFITANVPVGSQIPLCQANTTFVPRGAWPPSTVEDPIPANTGLSFSFSLPVHYVDWCDAYAYCKWSGKQLCGEINGQGLDPADKASAAKSAWYNACSAQGVKGWPFGVTYDDTLCNNHGTGSIGTNTSGATDGGNDPALNCLPPRVSYSNADCTYGQPGGVFQDDGIYAVVKSDNAGNVTSYAHAGCQGGSVGLYQMSGNVAEWEDSCTDGGADAAAGPSQSCGIRGGSYTANGDQNQLRCDALRTEQRMPPTGAPDPLADVGFRCCVY